MRDAFTVEQANATLPLVKRIVEDIVRHYARWQEMQVKSEALVATRSESQEAQAGILQQEIQKVAAEIDRFLAELNQIGVAFKGFDLGLVDFPAVLNGEQVWLCWRLGEDEVGYWHRLDEGFAGRQPLP